MCNTETQLPYSDFSIHVLYESQSTDMPPIADRYSTDIWHSLYWPSVDWCVGQHIGWPTRGQVSANILIDISTNMAIERRPILSRHVDRHIGPYCQPILNQGVHKLHKIPFMFAITQRQIAQREEKTLTLFGRKSHCKH